MLVSKIKPCKS